MRRLFAPPRASLLALLLCATLAPVLAAPDSFDIVGLRLGMTEQQARAQFKASSYMLVKFKVSKGRCHEFYAVEHDGTVVEAYVHPVTGKTVRITRVPPQPGAVKP